MVSKLFEIRDKMTMIPVLATAISREDGYLARRAGFGDRGCIQLTYFSSNKSHYDPYEWTNRTLRTAHVHIEANWDMLPDHSVIDDEFILGETRVPKDSESAVYADGGGE